MAIQLHQFREYANGSVGIVVWTDDTKTGADGEPDPAYLRPFTYGPVPQGVTKANYLAACRRETKLLIQAELADATDDGKPLAGEGQTL